MKTRIGMMGLMALMVMAGCGQKADTRIAEQIAVATMEKIDCEQFQEWMRYKDSGVSDIGIKKIEAMVKGKDGDALEDKLKVAFYEKVFSEMSNSFRPMATSGVRIKGIVIKPGKTTARVRCDAAASDELRVCQNVNRSGVVNGEPVQFGFCILRCDPKRFGETSRIDLIGDDLQIVTFTNENSETYQCASYRPR